MDKIINKNNITSMPDGLNFDINTVESMSEIVSVTEKNAKKLAKKGKEKMKRALKQSSRAKESESDSKSESSKSSKSSKESKSSRDDSDSGSESGSDDGSGDSEGYSESGSESEEEKSKKKSSHKKKEDSGSDSGVSDISHSRKKRSENKTAKDAQKRELSNKINRFRKMDGYIVPKIGRHTSVSECQKILEELRYEQRYISNIRFYRMMIKFIGWAIEKVTVRIGFSTFIGYATHIDQTTQEFDEFYDEMTEPVWEKDSNGKLQKIEKKNIITAMSSTPELAIIARFGYTMTVYAFINKLDTLAELVKD